jgi:Ca-activated chloride channel family protein
MIRKQSQLTELRRTLRVGIGVALLFSAIWSANAAYACLENAMLVFDASGSMVRRHNGRTRVEIAREAAADVLPDVTSNRPTGLVTYGGLAEPACRDVVVRVEPEVGSGKRIVAELERLQPLGPTALTASVRTAAEILKRFERPGIIVLITDGIENCGGKVCKLAQQLRNHKTNIRVHVISFFLDSDEIGALKCLIEQTGGKYAPANSLESLRDALRSLLSCHRIS